MSRTQRRVYIVTVTLGGRPALVEFDALVTSAQVRILGGVPGNGPAWASLHHTDDGLPLVDEALARCGYHTHSHDGETVALVGFARSPAGAYQLAAEAFDKVACHDEAKLEELRSAVESLRAVTDLCAHRSAPTGENLPKHEKEF